MVGVREYAQRFAALQPLPSFLAPSLVARW
jgi:hypothetical protein